MKALAHVAAGAVLVLGCLMIGARGALADVSLGTSAILSGAFSATAVSADGRHTVTLSGQFQGSFVNSQDIEVFGCEAVAGADAASTGITTCTLNAAPAPSSALPGPVAATTADGAFSITEVLNGLQLCGQANATFLDDSTTLSAYGCTTTPLISGATICTLTSPYGCSTFTTCIKCTIANIECASGLTCSGGPGILQRQTQ